DWAPLGRGLPSTADLYIANRSDKLIRAMPRAGRTVFWIHNPARYILKWRYLWKLFATRPAIVFIGAYHATTCPTWVPDGGRAVIPYGVPEQFRNAMPGQGMPGPRAVFTSNPLRGLDWLLDLWAESIQPHVEGASLHVFSGPTVYGQVGADKAVEMQAVLDKAAALTDKGVVLRGPVPKRQLIEEFRQARAMVYRGTSDETFCLAVAEAQAMGVPCVVRNFGSMPERVDDGRTGFVAKDEADFAAAAVELLRDDALWQRQHDAALAGQRKWSWADAAQAFENLGS
ncbi:MAG: glycosyltransferase, partial [Alphaproteobacteria bacterium]|nr:glycosyltransferase [Alphaproteobacteria bacterium]